MKLKNKNKHKKQNNSSKSLVILLVLLLAGIGVYYYFKPSITGFVVKESSYSDDVNLVVASTRNYTWQLGNPGDLKSLKLDGSITAYGKARVYVESDNARYLIFDSEKLNISAEQSGNLITGLVVKDDNDKDKKNESGKGKDNSKPDWTSGVDTFTINGTALINLSQHFTDEDGDALTYSASEVDGLSAVISGETAALAPTASASFSTKISFTASDGKDSKTETVDLIVIIEQSNETNATQKINHAPAWSGTDSFILNKTITINLLQYFADEDNDTLTFIVSDAANIDETLDVSSLALSTAQNNFNSSITITASDGNLSASKEITLIVPAEEAPAETRAITISLAYKSGTVYDTNDNGIELIRGAVDLTVEGTSFSWDADKSRACTRWEVYNTEDETSTTFCNGNSDCCAFVSLLSSNPSWDEVYYSTFNKDGAGYDNTVSSQIIYYDVNTSPENPKSEIYYSEWKNLSVKFYDEEIKFSNVCVETCSLLNLNKSFYNLIIEVEDNATLKIDVIKYTVAVTQIENNAPLLLKNFSTINIIKNKNVTINLSGYFGDSDGDVMAYGYYKPENITILFDNNFATILPDNDFEGTRYTYITANDSKDFTVSNVFEINVAAQKAPVPILNTTLGSFEIRDKEDNLLAVFDSFGNLNIKGIVTQNTEPTADSDDFAVQDSANILNAVILNPEGNLIIKGALSENVNVLEPTPNSFIIQDRNGNTAAYFNSTGGLFLKGALTENVVFPNT